MRTVIIACQTIEKELLSAIAAVGVDYPVRWIESGLHNVPKKLKHRLQEELDACRGFDRVLLAMAFCGNSILGLKTHDFELIVPRCDDCITLLLGSGEQRQKESCTYFLTEGWLRGERNIWVEYQTCLSRYGDKRAKKIFDSLLANYRYLALVETGAYDADGVEIEAKQIAQSLGLEYRRIRGGINYLCQLLQGTWPEERFVCIPANSEITPENCAPKGGQL